MQSFNPAAFSPDPSPNDIHAALTKAPPLGRGDLLQSFLNRAVRWQTYFFGGTPIHTYAPDIVRLQCTARIKHTHVSLSIFATVNLADYPELRTAQRYQGIVLYGVTTAIDEFTFELNLCGLELQPHHFWDASLHS